MKDLKDKVVVITGGATGIGFALAKAFGAEGAKIVIGEPREERLQEAVAALEELGIEAAYTICDVTDPAQVEALADFAWDRFGQVDVLINNAGVGSKRARAVDLPLEDLHKVFDVNFFGVWHGATIFAKRMEAQGTPAAIYNVGSENSFFTAAPGVMAAYVATKHAVLGFTEAFREETPDFIQVGTIFPGFVKSELTAGAAGELAMDTDVFASTVLKQFKAGEHFIVSHAYNIERIRPRFQQLEEAFAAYAPRYDGDEEYDIRNLMARLSRGSRPDR
ncbi:MAG: SDR family oxidoreductase [Pseudomonadota bacterium]